MIQIVRAHHHSCFVGESACDDDVPISITTYRLQLFLLTWNASRCWCPYAIQHHQITDQLRWFLAVERFQRRSGKLGRGDDGEDCQLVMATNRLSGCCLPLARWRRVGGGWSSRPTVATGEGGRIWG